MYTWTYKDKRAHFLAMPRTASKSVRQALCEAGATIQDSHHGLQKFDEVVQPGDIVMTTVRNHWDWMVSYWYLSHCPGTFEHFVPETCREAPWIRRDDLCTHCELYWNYVPRATYVLRYENLQADLDAALDGWPKVTIPASKESKPRPYQSYYKPGVISYVASRFEHELYRYGYKFDE